MAAKGETFCKCTIHLDKFVTANHREAQFKFGQNFRACDNLIDPKHLNLQSLITGSEATIDNALKVNSIKSIIIIISSYVFPFTHDTNDFQSFLVTMYGVGWFSAYLICINLINFSSLIHIESMLAPLGWVVSVVCPPGVFLRMFEIPLDNFVSSRDKNFPVGNFCSRVASQIIYIAKKNNRPIFSLDKSTQEIQRKKQRWQSEQ